MTSNRAGSGSRGRNAAVAGEPPVRLEEGDVILFPQLRPEDFSR